MFWKHATPINASCVTRTPEPATATPFSERVRQGKEYKTEPERAAPTISRDPWTTVVNRGRLYSNKNVPHMNSSANPSDFQKNGKEFHSKRPRQMFIGKKVSTGDVTWGGVDLLAHRYLGIVQNAVEKETIENDLNNRGISNLTLVENLNKKHSRLKSFKMSFSRNQCSTVDDPSFWPENVILCFWNRPRLPREGAPRVGDTENRSNTATSLDPLDNSVTLNTATSSEPVNDAASDSTPPPHPQHG
jgi:hypothetical protein